jgi:hypothetical protein
MHTIIPRSPRLRSPPPQKDVRGLISSVHGPRCAGHQRPVAANASTLGDAMLPTNPYVTSRPASSSELGRGTELTARPSGASVHRPLVRGSATAAPRSFAASSGAHLARSSQLLGGPLLTSFVPDPRHWPPPRGRLPNLRRGFEIPRRLTFSAFAAGVSSRGGVLAGVHSVGDHGPSRWLSWSAVAGGSCRPPTFFA